MCRIGKFQLYQLFVNSTCTLLCEFDDELLADNLEWSTMVRSDPKVDRMFAGASTTTLSFIIDILVKKCCCSIIMHSALHYFIATALVLFALTISHEFQQATIPLLCII